MIRWLPFGYDIFLSYAHADATVYSANLGSLLTARGFACYLDQWASTPGERIPPRVLSALRRSSMLVVVGSPAAGSSNGVMEEVRTFRDTGRVMVPIDPGGLRDTPLGRELVGLAFTVESPENLALGQPGPEILARVAASADFTRKSARLQRFFAATFLSLGVGIVLSALVGVWLQTRIREGQATLGALKASQKQASQVLEETRRRLDEKAEEIRRGREQLQQVEVALTRAEDLASYAEQRAGIVEGLLGEAEDELARSNIGLDLVRQALQEVKADLSVSGEDLARAAIWASRTPGLEEETLLAAIRAANIAPGSPTSTSALQAALLALRNARPLRGVRECTWEPVFSHDSRIVALIAVGGAVGAWETDTGRLIWNDPGTRPPVKGTCRRENRPSHVYNSWRSIAFDHHTGRLAVIPGPVATDACGVLVDPIRGNVLTPLQDPPHHECPQPGDPVAYTADDSTLVAGTAYGVLRWNTGDGSYLGKTRYPSGMALGSLQLSPFSTRIYVDTGDFRAQILDPLTGRRTNTLARHPSNRIVVNFPPVFSADGARLVTSWFGGTRWDAALWSAEGSRHPVLLAGTGEGANHAAISPDQRFVATAGTDGVVRLYETRRGDLARSLTAHNDNVSSVAFSPGGGRLASAGTDGTVRIWDPESGEIVQWIGGHERPVYAVAFSPDGSMIVTVGCGEDPRVTRTDLAPRLLELRVASGAEGVIVDVALGGDDVLIAGPGARVRVLSISAGRFSWSGDAGAPVVAGQFAPDGTQVLVSTSEGRTRVWDVETGREGPPLDGVLPGISDRKTGPSRAVSQDGARVVLVQPDGTVVLWDRAGGRETWRYPPPPQRSGAVWATLAPGEAWVLVHDGRTRLLDARTGQPSGPSLEGLPAFLSPSGPLATVHGDEYSEMRLPGLSLESRTEIRPPHEGQGLVSVTDFSASNGRFVAAAYRWDRERRTTTCGIWTPRHRRETGCPDPNEHVTQVAISEDGRTILVDAQGGMPILADADTLATVAHLDRHPEPLAWLGLRGDVAVTLDEAGVLRAFHVPGSPPEPTLARACEVLRPFPGYADVTDLCDPSGGNAPSGGSSLKPDPLAPRGIR